MATDYRAIKAENEGRYGTDVERWGRHLLTNRYDDRTHFIFELLQNAEDALDRRKGWHGSRAVRFTLFENELRVTHCGQPFDGHNVRGICGIAESTKHLTAIGRFGIGFKSVYAFTQRPEVHSGGEDFAIESFVWPTTIPPLDRQADETVFVLPLGAGDEAAHAEITDGLRRLGPRTLLFLRQIDEISWSAEGGPSGLYVRGRPQEIGENVRRIVLLGEEYGKPDIEEAWLLFSREAKTSDGAFAGHVEIAFSIKPLEQPGHYSVQPVSDSPLVVFFPTVLPTHLGFLVQGPYRTTPSRDNVPRNDPWNQHLVQQTATLVVEALRSLRAQGLLDIGALRCLPLDREDFTEGNMFAPLFATVREALRTEPLLPAYGTGHAAASTAMLARTQELRELFDPGQLARVFGADDDILWLSADITTQDRTSELRQYLLRELDIVEATPESILPRLTQEFLEEQSDEWTSRFYEFLHGQPALLRQGRLKDVPLVRLEDGRHVTPIKDGRPQAFLPGPIATDFPTVRSQACGTEAARALLLALGLTEPDPVDDVVRNVLPKYNDKQLRVGDEEYETDIHRILAAFGTDSKAQRDKLLGALQESAFVRAVNPGDGSKSFSLPGNVYQATERMKDLFAGVEDVLLVDDSYPCLRGEDVRELLEVCGTTRYLQTAAIASTFTWHALRDMRIAAGCESMSSDEPPEDHTLRGLDSLLVQLPGLDASARTRKAALLWEALADVQDRRGTGTFSGGYRWFYFHRRSTTFNAAFVRQLNAVAWVPDQHGELQRPELVLFDTLGWKPNPYLLSRIRFKPPIIDQLAKEAGIEPGVLDLLKKHGLTSVADLVARLAISAIPRQAESGSGGETVEQAIESLLGDTPGPTPPLPDPSGAEPCESGVGFGGSGSGSRVGAESRSGNDASERSHDHRGARTEGGATGSTKRTPGGASGRPFISYIAVQPDDEDQDPDGLDQQARMALEGQAIDLVLAREPKWQRTPTHNPGYDLFEPGEGVTPARWCEVKAMTGSLRDRPVGLSRTQFDCARERGDAYWLYVVEHAGESDARVVRIQDPAGNARTFTFDRGWLGIADVDTEQEDRED
jgi:uncharacterized protein DUF3883